MSKKHGDHKRPEAGTAQPTDDRLALLEPDGRLRVPGMVVVDPHGVERIVVEADDHSAKIRLQVSPAWSPPGTSEIYLYAQDGDDADLSACPPEVGFEAVVGGNAAVSFSAGLTTKTGVLGAGEPELNFYPWF